MGNDRSAEGQWSEKLKQHILAAEAECYELGVRGIGVYVNDAEPKLVGEKWGAFAWDYDDWKPSGPLVDNPFDAVDAIVREIKEHAASENTVVTGKNSDTITIRLGSDIDDTIKDAIMSASDDAFVSAIIDAVIRKAGK